MDVKVVHHGAGVEWSGGTRLNCPVTTAIASLPAGPSMAVATVHQWLEEHAEHYPDNEPPAVTLDDSGERGTWSAAPVPAPFVTPPFSINLELVVGLPCPWPVIQPWWDALSVPASGELTTRQPGTRVSFSRRIPPGRWTSPRTPHAQSASLDVIDGVSLVARCTYVASERRIKETGFVGSFVPGYREARDLASSLSDESHYLETGGRLGFEHISSIELEITNSNVAPLIGAELKQLVATRGFGEMQESRIRVVTSDGWGPLRIELRGPPGGSGTVHSENQLIAWAGWLRAAVAHHRLHSAGDWISPEDRLTLEETLADATATLATTTEPKRTIRGAVWDLPGSLPISVPASMIDQGILQA